MGLLQVWVPSRLCGAALWAGLQWLSGEQVPARCRMCGRHQRLHLCLQGGLQVSSQAPRNIREVTVYEDMPVCWLAHMLMYNSWLRCTDRTNESEAFHWRIMGSWCDISFALSHVFYLSTFTKPDKFFTQIECVVNLKCFQSKWVWYTHNAKFPTYTEKYTR